MTRHRPDTRRAALTTSLLALVLAPALAAAQRITSPAEEFGHAFGDDYFLANYQQIAAYWHKLERESDRIVVREIGTTAEGRPHYMAIVTSPENHANLERYREISARLALAEGLTDEQARALARDGKAVVWIDGGLHASEVLGAQQLGETVYQFVSMSDPETLRILDDVIILFVHANPDGNDLLADWYMRNPVPEERSTSGVPKLYQKYIGHDNNRDFFASTQAETENINRVLYHDWLPQILYNHHQSGPRGTVVWSPPLRDPYNYNLDPLIVLGFQQVGAAMHARLAAEGKGGATMREGGPYDGWWNGGIRNTAAFHGTIAMLTEMIGSPTPSEIPFVASRQLPSMDLALPATPGPWHFRQSVDYSVSLNRAVLDYAERMRENLLYNRYLMGRRGIERGSTDTWTVNPKRLAEVAAGGGRGGGEGRGGGAGRGAGGGAGAGGGGDPWTALHAPELRDPRGYIIPSDQADFLTAVKFINALRETGIPVQRATAPFTVDGTTYPAGSFVVFAAQAFRPHVIDMFEPQVHPDVFPYPGAPPTPPYDNAGWTLAFQMGVEFDRILDGFTGPFEPVTDWNVAPPAGAVRNADGATGFLTRRRLNDSFIAVNRLLAAGEEVWTLGAELDAGGPTDPQSATDPRGAAYPAGTFYVRARASTRATVDRIAADLGVAFDGVRGDVPAGAQRLRAPRVGLWDRFGGSIDAGWARWILEQFEFPFERVFAPRLDAGNLNADYDVLVFVGGAVPGAARGAAAGAAAGAAGGGGGGGRAGGRAGGGRAGGGGGGRAGGGRGAGPDLSGIPAEYHDQVGSMSAGVTMPRIREFIERGGTVVAIGSSAENLAQHLDLPIENHLTQGGRPLPRTEFYVPGSVLRARVDVSRPAAFGMTDHADFFFDDSPVFRLAPAAAAAGIAPIAWFDSTEPLRSGWAWGQQALEGGVIGVEARVGEGRVLLFTPQILKRAQPHGTFKLLFNSILGAAGGS